MPFVSGTEVYNRHFAGNAPNYPTDIYPLSDPLLGYPDWFYNAGDYRYFLNFNRVPSWGSDHVMPRLDGVPMAGPGVTLRMMLYRWHTNDTTATFGRLCCFVADGGPIGHWDHKRYLWAEATRDTAGSVAVSVGWKDGDGVTSTDITLASTSNVPWDMDYSAYLYLRVEWDAAVGISGAWMVRAYTTPQLIDGPIGGHNPEDVTLWAEAEVPAEILTLVGHTSVGFVSGTAGVPGFPLAYSGLAPLTFTMWTHPPPLTPCGLLLQVYDDDRLSLLWEVSTDRFHANPLLAAPEFYESQAVDPANGSASIGTVTVTVVDRPLVAGDQDGGFVTDRLASFGVANLAGRRARLLRFVDDTVGYVVVADGPASAVTMEPDYASFSFTIRDVRDTERKVRLFDSVTRSLIPDEHLEDYADLGLFPLSAAARPLRGHVYRADNYPTPSYIEIAVGLSEFPENGRRILVWQAAYSALLSRIGRTAHASSVDSAVGAAWQSAAVALDLSGQRIHNPTFEFRWRILGSSGAYTVVPGEFLAVTGSTVDSTVTESARVMGRVVIEDVRLNPGLSTYSGAAADLPDTDDLIEFFLVGTMPPDQDHPVVIDAVTAGQFLQDVYDGLHSEPDPLTGLPIPTGIRYDSAAMALLTTPLRFRQFEPVEDAREWLERRVYGALGWMPALDYDGRISPVSRIPPADTSTLPVIDDTVAAPTPVWSSGGTVINAVQYSYVREYFLAYYDPLYFMMASQRQPILGQHEVVLEWQDPASIARHGRQLLALDGTVLTATGFQVTSSPSSEGLAVPPGGGILSKASAILRQLQDRRSRVAAENDGLIVTPGGAVVPYNFANIDTEAAYQQGLLAQLHLLARYRHGAPTFTVPVRRSLLPTLRAGSWINVSLSWLPDYLTARRGLWALGQVIAISDLDCAWREITVEVVELPDES